MPITMYKMLFPHTNVNELIKYIKKKMVLCTCNNSFIPQMGICKLTLIYEDFEYECNASARKWVYIIRDVRL